MRKIIKNLGNNYLYQRIVSHTNQNQYQYQKKLEKYNKDSEKIIFDKIKYSLKDNNKNISISNTSKITLNEMLQYFDNIYNFYQKNNQESLMTLTNIIKNLLFTKKDNGVIFNFDDVNNEEIFTINDFIYNYILEALDKILFNNELIQENIEDLYDTYLYLIFQIQDPNFIIKLRILIYNNLYTKRDIIEFIIKSSESIAIKENFDNKTLIELQKQYNEIDINIKIVPDNVNTFFNKKNMNIDEILNFFTKENIENNFEKIKNKKINIEEIVVDGLNYNQNKVYFFSPEFLIVNGFKSDFEKCDFELFNSDNYNIDIYSKFINLIITKINKCIKQNNFSNDFMNKNSIQFHTYTFLHFISTKLDYVSKEKLNLDKKDIKEKDSPKINLINNIRNEILYEEEKEKENIIKPKEEDIDINIEDENINFHFPSVSIISSTNSAFEFEEISTKRFKESVNDNLIESLSKDNIISLPNILFMLNLKIPEYNHETNSMKFKSVHLDFFNNMKIYENINYFYGFKEMDSIIQNNSKKPIKVFQSYYFYNNLTYVKNENDICFHKEEEKDAGVKVNPNTLFFFEIKKSFPNFEIGREDVPNLKVNENKSEIKNKGNSFSKSYDNQLIKFIKNFKYFMKVFKDKNDIKKVKNMHFVFLCDSYNIYNDYPYIDDVLKLSEQILSDYSYIFRDIGKVTFQFAFFNFCKYCLKMDEIVKEIKEKEEKEKQKEIEKKKKQLEKEKQLEKKDNLNQSQNDIVERIKNIIYNDELTPKQKEEKIFELLKGSAS